MSDYDARLDNLERSRNYASARLYALEGQVGEMGERLDELEARIAGPEQCGVAQPGDVGGWYGCDRPQGHEGQHGCDGVEWSDPEPVPQWRALVDEYASETPAEDRVATSWVLNLLAEIASGENWQKPDGELAQIVAHCEAQVGDGWQADPDDFQEDESPDIDSLIDALGDIDRWQVLGDRAAAWLRDLTEGQS